MTVSRRHSRRGTSETGGIVSFSQQLDVSLDGNPTGTQRQPVVQPRRYGRGITGAGQNGLAKWDTAVTVFVRAHENQRVDGGDTQGLRAELDS